VAFVVRGEMVGLVRRRSEDKCVKSRVSIVGLKRDGPCAETRFRLSEKRTSPFEWAGVSG
jgi:hypothetical protein